MLAVRRPAAAGELAGGGIGLHIPVVIIGEPGVVPGAVGGEGAFHQGGVLGIFGGLFQVFAVHHPQVVILHIQADGAVRAHVRPVGIFVGMLFGVPGEGFGGDIIVETIFHELAGGVAGAVPLLRLGFHIPLEAFVFLELQLQVQVLGVVRVTGYFRELAGQLFQVEDFLFGAGGGVYQVIAGTFGRFPAVPEFIAVGEPVGTDAGAVHHIAHALAGEAGGLGIIGLLYLAGFLGLLGLERHAQQQADEGKDSFHTYADMKQR